MAMGYIIAWTPFATLSIFETFYPPTEIPSGILITSKIMESSTHAISASVMASGVSKTSLSKW